MKKTAQLKKLITSGGLNFIMEAHNGLSAKIVEETGFKGVWASGLSISAALGVRDNNEASWTQILEVLEFMSDATSIPILVDGDTGYGNFNNMRRLVKKLEQRDIGGVCIEDKLFPKTNSFISGDTQPLANIDEFCGKIKAAKDTQKDPDFCVVARVEAFIAGWGLDEAIRRAEAYRLAGADAILVHSKKNSSIDIEQFMKIWNNRHPIVIVPTKYYSTPTRIFYDLGINLIIWANHNLRASINIMKDTSKKIYITESLKEVEDNIATVSEIFRLQDAKELQDAEAKYLPTSNKKIKSIILAASQGNLGNLVKDKPKTMLYVNGKSLLEHQVSLLNEIGINDITVVTGFKPETIDLSNIKKIQNDKFNETRELYSLHKAIDTLEDEVIYSFGDIIYKKYILNDLLINDNSDISIIVDSERKYQSEHDNDYVITDYSHEYDFDNKDIYLKRIKTGIIHDPSTMPSDYTGEFIGVWKTNAKGTKIIKDKLDELIKLDNRDYLDINYLFNELIKDGNKIKVHFIKGSWLDIDSYIDIQKLNNF